uniref:Nuclear protein SET n=1 Tax=Rhodopseudomonas palustris (strain BisA53) TaxID=316055 RepID=Q07RA7_RHOP5
MPAIPASKPYRVGRAKTGLGLFATQPIKKGTKIIRYFGPLLDCHKEKDDAVENKYLFQLNKRWTIDGSIRKNIARYINHSCKPNAESDVNPRKKKIVIRAIKNIEPGEEINYDYGTDYFKEYLKPIGCKCDSCEKKRKKQRAEARAERLALKAKEEKKAAKKAAKDKAKSNAKVGNKAKAMSGRGKTLKSKAGPSPRKTAATSAAAQRSLKKARVRA